MRSGLTTPGGGETFPYAGAPVHVLAGRDGGPWAAAEFVVPPLFRGPVPHVHDTFDEALYIVEGVLLVASGHDEPVEAPTGSLFTALRGTRHAFRNPEDRPTRVLGLWSPPRDGLDFTRAVGRVLPASGAPDPETVRAIYEQHHSHLVPD